MYHLISKYPYQMKLKNKKEKKKDKSFPGRVKFYADENIDIGLIQYLRKVHKVNITSALEMGFHSREDHFHFQEAKRQKRFLLTCDKDFLNHSRFPFNQMLGAVILDVPSGFPGLGWMSWWLEEHIVPSGKEIRGTKIVLHAESIDIYFIDETGKIEKQIIQLS
jgi:hypothetical protein